MKNWQFHIRPIYRHGRRYRYIAVLTSTTGRDRSRNVYATTLPHQSRNEAVREAHQVARLLGGNP